MDISAEKEEIISRFNLIHDIDLIKAIRSLLDFGLQRQENDEDNIALRSSIEKGLSDSKNGFVRPHEEVMADLRKRYNI